jgi:hypothetical protein
MKHVAVNEKLFTLADYLEREVSDGEFDMSTCHACICGHALRMQDRDFNFDGSEDWIDVGAEALGIDRELAIDLFLPGGPSGSAPNKVWENGGLSCDRTVAIDILRRLAVV